MHVVELWDCELDLTCIVKLKSGVVFTNQVAGNACRHPECEGVLLPLTMYKHVDLDGADPLQNFYETTTRPITEVERASLIANWLRWAGAADVFEPRADEELAEAWIPVRVRKDVMPNLQPLIGAFAGFDAVLTYINSD